MFLILFILQSLLKRSDSQAVARLFHQKNFIFSIFQSKKKSRKRLCLPDFSTPRVGLEPTTTRLTAERSTDWAIEDYSVFSSVSSVCITINALPTELSRIILSPAPSKLHINILHSMNSRSSLRPISICQLHMLPCFHPRPIHLVVFKGSYWLLARDILSWGGLHA